MLVWLHASVQNSPPAVRLHWCPKTGTGLYGSSRYLISSGVSWTFSASRARSQYQPSIEHNRIPTNTVLEVFEACSSNHWCNYT